MSCESISWLLIQRASLTDAQAGTERTVEEWLMKKFEGVLVRAEREKKWDLYLVSAQLLLVRVSILHSAKPPSVGTSSLP
jgi:DNA polymerase epsilon subunit 1